MIVKSVNDNNKRYNYSILSKLTHFLYYAVSRKIHEYLKSLLPFTVKVDLKLCIKLYVLMVNRHVSIKLTSKFTRKKLTVKSFFKW